MYIESNKDELSNYFPYPCEIVETTGIGEGTILKFKTFYLKIYNGDNENTYIIKKYRYGCDKVISTDEVPYNRMREYALQLIP